MVNPRIENWAMVFDHRPSLYAAPELINRGVIIGEVFNHPSKKHQDGKFIKTSSLQSWDLLKGIAVTRNTTYKLGVPRAAWIKWLGEQGYDDVVDVLSLLIGNKAIRKD